MVRRFKGLRYQYRDKLSFSNVSPSVRWAAYSLQQLATVQNAYVCCRTDGQALPLVISIW